MLASTPDERMMQPAITERAAFPVHKKTKLGTSPEAVAEIGSLGLDSFNVGTREGSVVALIIWCRRRNVSYWIVTTVPTGVRGQTV